MSRPSPRRVLADAIREILTSEGPLTYGDLGTALEVRGLSVGDDLEHTIEAAIGDDEVFVFDLDDGRIGYLPAVLHGRTFTHRLRAFEVAGDILAIDIDLLALSSVIDEPGFDELAGGGPVTIEIPDLDDEILIEREVDLDELPPDGAIVLPIGTLSDLQVPTGALVAVRAMAEGPIVELIDEIDAAGSARAATAKVLDELIRRDRKGDEPTHVEGLIWTACAHEDGAFSEPIAPLSELLPELGLDVHGLLVAPAGFDFAAWNVTSQLRFIREMHELTEDEARAVVHLLTIHERFAEILEDADEVFDPGSDDVALLDAALALLDHDGVAEAVADEAIVIDEDAAALGFMAENLEARAPSNEARAALRWLRGHAYELLGEVLDAESCFEAALHIDPGCGPALVDLAGYASDRGDAERGLRLLAQAGVGPDDPLVQVLEHFRPKPSKLGRNDPCWCGSGQKYKRCHLGNELLPLDERAAWLYEKAHIYLQESSWQALLLQLAGVRAQYADDAGAPPLAVTDGFVTDVALFEGGAFEAFVTERGPFLPADELLLAQRWLLVDRRLYEVESVRRDAGITVRDLRTGDHLDVHDLAASRSLEPHELWCGRIVPVGATHQILGGLETVSPAERGPLLELLDDDPDPIELVALLSRRFALPTLPILPTDHE